MIGVYFSGTGNTEYCIREFLSYMDSDARAFSIEKPETLEAIKGDTDIVLAYPVHFSNIPCIVREFLQKNIELFINRNIFIIATMGLFSGDGAGCAARILQKAGGHIIGALHLRMPDCVGDKKALKKTLNQNRAMIKSADEKIHTAAKNFREGKPTKEGLGLLYHIAGLFGQRLWFCNAEKSHAGKLKIDSDQCVGCGKCVSPCPTGNLSLNKGKAVANSRCTLCYRCVNSCPGKAITMLGKEVIEQCGIGNYI